jgi:Ca2+:H+ antiporter
MSTCIEFRCVFLSFLVLLGWWINKPMHILFDYYELALLLGSCFLVNYVTADAKTNWVRDLVKTRPSIGPTIPFLG